MTEYTIHELAKISGVSSRTLRHYDAVGLLKPMKKTAAGYRVYGPLQVNLLQQILLYKTTGMKLRTIKKIVSDPSFDIVSALYEQRDVLIQQKHHLESVITTINQSIKANLGETTMSDDQKFASLKQQLIAENDHQYGNEVKERWGEETWKESNKKFADMSPEQFELMNRLDREFKAAMQVAFTIGNPESPEALKAVDLHRQWLSIFWPTYSKEAHLGLAQMYIDDERFHHYFDNRIEVAEFFRDAVQARATE